jgi:hypothetical protein
VLGLDFNRPPIWDQRFTMFRLLVGAALMFTVAACGGAPEEEVAADTLGESEANLSSTVFGPLSGECTSTQTLNKTVNSAGNPVIRGTCSVVCKKYSSSMGVWNLVLQFGSTTSPQVSNIGAGTSRSAHVNLPYVPGTYAVSCTPKWGSDFRVSFPYTSAKF